MPERVEVVAGEQRQVVVVAGEQPRLAVVEQVALADRLDDRATRRPRRRAAGSTQRAAEIGVALARAELPRARSRSASRSADPFAAFIRRTSARESAAASRVRSIASSSWASETNQASNCDGGG